MDIIAVAAILSTLFAVYANVPCIQTILNGKTKPHQFSWLIILILNFVIFVSQYLEGGRASILVAFVSLVGSVIIVILSFKKGVRNTSNIDKLLFISSLVLLALWVFTRSNELAIWLTVAITFPALGMTFLKVKNKPDSEDPKAWVYITIAYAFSCITLIGVPFGILYVRPIAGLLFDGLLVVFIYYMLKKHKSKKI